MWSQDAQLADGAPLKINGIAFDGHHTLYTTYYSTGALLRIDVNRDGTATPATVVTLKQVIADLPLLQAQRARAAR